MTNVICWYFGCKQDNASKDSEFTCGRCGGYVEYSDLVGYTRHRRLMERLFGWFPKKCNDCGKRFGNHDGCLPF